jgi:predicted AAA+ superfamily ATPase
MSKYWPASPERWSTIPSSTLGISLATVKIYLGYLEKTFILWKATPWFTNIRKEITKAPVYYFRDLGLRNFASGSFGALSDSAADRRQKTPVSG